MVIWVPDPARRPSTAKLSGLFLGQLGPPPQSVTAVGIFLITSSVLEENGVSENGVRMRDGE